MLVAEDILLLITATEKRSIQYVELITAGGLLTDLAFAGNVRVTEPGESVRKSRIVAVPDATWPIDDLLVGALTVITAKPYWSARPLVDKLSNKLPATLYRRLSRAELVSGAESKVLGLFPTTRWTLIDRRRVAELHARLDEVFLFGAQPDPHVAALAALLSAGRLIVPVLDRGRKVDRKQVKRRALELQKQYWAADAVQQAIQSRETDGGAAAG